MRCRVPGMPARLSWWKGLRAESAVTWIMQHFSVAFSSLGLLASQSMLCSAFKITSDGWASAPLQRRKCRSLHSDWHGKRRRQTAPEVDSLLVKKDLTQLEDSPDVLLWLSLARAGVRSVHLICRSTSVPLLNLTSHCLPRSATTSTIPGCCSLHTAAPALQHCPQTALNHKVLLHATI